MQAADAIPPESRPVCPEHPEKPSVATCERCGRFLCEACVDSREPPRCDECHLRLSDVYGVLAQPFSIGQSLRGGWRLFRAVLPTVLPAAVLFGIPGGLYRHLVVSRADTTLGMWQLMNVYEALLGNLVCGTWLALLVGIAEGRRPSATQAFQQGMEAWPRIFGARFRSGLQTLLYGLLLVIPGIIRNVTLTLSTESAFREPGRDALDNSARLVTGRRWEVLGLLVAIQVPFLIGSAMVGAVFGFLKGMVPSSALGGEILTDAAFRIMEALSAAVGMCAFYGFKRLHDEPLTPR